MVYINSHVDQLDLEAALAQVSAQRRDQAMKINHEAGRRLCVAAYLLLWQGLQREYGFTSHPLLDYGPHGKPFIAGRPDLFFNLSHSGHVAVCALDSRPVGIDVETIRQFREPLGRYVLSDEEFLSVASAPYPDRAFTRLWTMKESLMKLRGTGIDSSLKHVLQEASQQVLFTTTETPDYIYTLCTPR